MTNALDMTGAERVPQGDPEALDDAQGDDDDPGAPYGRKPDGSAYKVPAGVRDALAAGRAVREANNRARGGGRRRTTSRRASSASTSSPPPIAGKRAPAPPPVVDYRPAVKNLIALPVMLLALGAKFTGNAALGYDSLTLTVHSPAICDVVSDAASQSEALAAMLDRTLQVGPYGEVIALGAVIGAQMMANHRMIAAQPELGILTPDQLIEKAQSMAR